MIKAQGGIFGWVSDSARILTALGDRAAIAESSERGPAMASAGPARP
jgi:hypothetical protein